MYPHVPGMTFSLFPPMRLKDGGRWHKLSCVMNFIYSQKINNTSQIEIYIPNFN